VSCALTTASNTLNGFDPVAEFNSAQTCWNGIAANGALSPFSASANTNPDTVTYCFPMRKNIPYRFPVISGNLIAATQIACEQGNVQLCDCPNYYTGDFDYYGYWFGSVTVSEEDRLLNGLIALQWIVSRIVLSTPFLSWIDTVWYSFWNIFNMPIWWTHM